MHRPLVCKAKSSGSGKDLEGWKRIPAGAAWRTQWENNLEPGACIVQESRGSYTCFVRHLKKCLPWFPVCVSNRPDPPILHTGKHSRVKHQECEGRLFNVSQVIFHLKKKSFFKTLCSFCFGRGDLPAFPVCTRLAGTRFLGWGVFVGLEGPPEAKREMRGARCHPQQTEDFVRNTSSQSWPGALKCKKGLR